MLAFLALFLNIASAAVPAKTAPLPPLMRAVEAKYAKAATMTANFEETDESKALQQTKKSSGTLQFKRPGKVRWETLKPDRNLLVSDGKKFWYYTPPFDASEHGQYMEKKAAQVQSRFAQKLLSASFSEVTAQKTMKVEQGSPNSFILTPLKHSAGSIARVTVTIDPEKKVISSLVLEHDDGNRTEITLSDIQLGKKLGDETFKFVPPPNTDLIQE
jgi:outer membrane lipoprotein carrier protein